MGVSNSMSFQKHLLDHPRLRDFETLQSQDQQYLLLKVALAGDFDIKHFNLSTHKLDHFNQELIFAPIAIHSEESTYCGNMAVMKLFYPYYPFNLEVQIEDRRSTRVPFKVNELWYLLDSLVKVSKQFEKQKMLVGDIRPYNILLNSLGEIKIIAKHSIPTSNPELQSTDHLLAYSSPEQMKHSKENKFKPTLKMEVFSAGMTLLEALTFKNIYELYNHDLGVIDMRSIDILLQQAKCKYPPLMVLIVQKMLQQDPRSRPYFHEIDSILSPYSACIVESEPFNINIDTSFQNLALFHTCYKNYKSAAFLNIIHEFQQYSTPSSAQNPSPFRHQSQRLRPPPRTPTKPFISTAQKSPLVKQRCIPLYEQNYYKLKKIEEKRELSLKRKLS